MAHPRSRTPRQHQHPGSFGTYREREFFRYLPPYHLQTHPIPHIDRDTPSTFAARSSWDPALTSFAQLGTLRLHAKRTLISLFGRNEQVVLAEATQTLKIQDDDSEDARQGLWIGCCTMSYERSLCKFLMNNSQAIEKPQPLVVTNMTLHEDFKNHPDVTNDPHIRFMACSPIISPKGIVIGAYTVLDDKPHEPLDANSIKFLNDIAHTVMDHLVAKRSLHEHLRGERMIVGLGSFLEGKGSLRNSWINANESILTPSPGEDTEMEGHVNQQQQQKQISEHATPIARYNDGQGFRPFRPQNFNTKKAGKTPTQINQEREMATPDANARDYFYARPRNRRASHTTTHRDPLKKPPRDSYASKVKETFSRAANIIRESIEVEAVVFFDANFGSRDALVNTSTFDSESGGSSMESNSSSEEEAKRRGTPTQQDISSEPQIEHCGTSTKNPCKLLGFATSDAASVSMDYMFDKKVAISENFLGQLSRRYPRGKIFNFGEDGRLSSSETSDRGTSSSGGKKFKRTRRAFIRQDAVTLLQLAPAARSIVFSPLWDSHKGRWYSGCLTWTRAPHRVLTSQDELAFLFAVGHSVMAEVHRLGAVLIERAKSDLLAGISHELRSPLHGIFGTVDILNDTVMDVLQRGLVHTISSCAFTLLGSIDQLLEYASINDVRARPSKFEAQTAPNAVARQSSPLDKDSIVQLDAVVEDAIETVFAGYSFFKSPNSPLWTAAHTQNPFGFKGGVKVILDIDSAQNLKFATRPGAWHVILTNFFGNALKFTDEGFIYVSLKAIPMKFKSDGQATQSKVTLCIKDTGCGMEEEFLRSELFTAFSKEDRLSPGNGLGINIVNRIVSSLGGEIEISSQKGVGTEVVTTVTLDHIPERTSHRSLNDVPFPLSTRNLVKQKTIGILLHTSSDGDAALLSSIHKLCQNWFQMKVELVEPSSMNVSQYDFYISLHQSSAAGIHEMLPIRPRSNKQLPPPVIIICSSPRIAHTLASQDRREPGVFEFISQPCGPHKLAKTLESCLQRQQLRRDSLLGKRRGSSVSQPEDLDHHLNGRSKRDSIPIRNADPIPPLGPLQMPSEAFAEPLVTPVLSVPAGMDLDFQPEDYLAVHPQVILPRTILLADDNEINLKILVAFMNKLGYNYCIAHNGQEALDTFRKNARNIEIILMDISMPIMDGIEATRRIREFEKTLEDKQRTMILALTGVAQAETERDAIGSGMDAFLTKPARLNALRPIIKDRMPQT
ncbi:hypothetical protein N7520_004377 [Penicillium odoratum]|uniref:uncharacterized protein n=1 Tax=Penicillium odoratum TaxID=1167516 RepID=UPI00254791FC|nr:uncharacterized protein N7520_004377 [Penicillium odoratum]KAJ5764818.1 hypothetical protein N7520_004377 [Penicillium odoratum]